jgi:hypothetical protein
VAVVWAELLVGLLQLLVVPEVVVVGPFLPEDQQVRRGKEMQVAIVLVAVQQITWLLVEAEEPEQQVPLEFLDNLVQVEQEHLHTIIY